ncbi:hypothetical protein [Pyrobaculum ferrireducens]|uniref:Uncharacterized protein n=1 Tax=Pyrobaculum ferrireducens TaxID=1104324 RepID=G7VAH9_9CREN|nr:hypothetical protein [Pyrobaculum ferrireducens]AET32218.1 hypothetical protein P186_0772 [Pyrobaculum ferrireducens]
MTRIYLIYLLPFAVLLTTVVPLSNLTLGHVVLHVATPLMAAVPLYLSARAYLRTGGRRFLNLALAFAALFLSQLFLSLYMLTGFVVYLGDIPVDHFLGLLSFSFFTAALLVKDL